jgi:CheY-like chemotaxis protein
MFTAPEASVLVVDDIVTNLKVANGLLLPYKMQVDLCKSGMTAIEAMKKNRYDMVFMDHKMPGMDGIETTQMIRSMGEEDPYYKEVPVIALTANAVSGTKEMFLENGFNDYLSKPIDTVKLNAALERWIPKVKQESAGSIVK